MQGTKGRLSVFESSSSKQNSEGTEGHWCIMRKDLYPGLEQAHLRSDNTVTHSDQNPLKFLTALLPIPQLLPHAPQLRLRQDVFDTAASSTQSTCTQEAPQCGRPFTIPAAPPHVRRWRDCPTCPACGAHRFQGLYFQNLILRNTHLLRHCLPC